MYSAQISREMSLADELGGSGSGHSSLFVLKCSHLWDNDSPDSERLLTDADSGHSTAHSPTDGPKSMSPLLGTSPACMGGGTPYSDMEMLEATHRGLHKFIPRHDDEIEVEIGDRSIPNSATIGRNIGDKIIVAGMLSTIEPINNNRMFIKSKTTNCSPLMLKIASASFVGMC